MFDFVREKRWVVVAILGFITLPFAFWGVSSYDMSGNPANSVAVVNGAKITQQEFDAALRQQQSRMREQLGADFDASMFESPEMKRALVDNLVMQRLLEERAQAVGLVVTDEEMGQVIAGIEAFQDEGKFDKERYAAVLKSNNMTPLIYEARLRQELLGQKLRDSYVQNGYSSMNVAQNILRLTEQQRIVSVVPVSYQAYIAQVKVDEAVIKEYYDQNQSEFHVPDQARVEYVQLAIDDLLAKAEVGSEDARRYYDDHQNEFGTTEERQAAHILISVAPTASQAERDAAKVKAEGLLQQARKNPAGFAELARKNSQDPGSAANGGDLGFFGRGMMVKPFEAAAFDLKAGEISGLVQTDFGYHIIKLIAVKPSRVLPFDAARGGIMDKLRKQKAADMFAELAEKFSNTVYEQSDTLKPAAALAGAKITQSSWLTKGVAGEAPWTAKMLQAVFDDEAIKNKRNTAAIEVAPNTLVAARILEHKPATVRALNEVRETIRQKLTRQQAMALAAKQGRALLEQLQQGNKPALRWGAPQSITRLQPGALDRELARKVFQADAAGLPQYAGVEDTENGYLLARIDAVKESEAINTTKQAGYAQRLRQLTGEEMFQAYMSDAKQQAKIKINLPEKAPE